MENGIKEQFSMGKTGNGEWGMGIRE